MTDVSQAIGGYQVELQKGDGGFWAECEAELQGRGVSVALEHRSSWLETVVGKPYPVVAVYGGGRSGLVYALPLERMNSRVLPGHFRFRLSLSENASEPSVIRAILSFLATCTEAHPRLLETQIELFGRGEVRKELERWARGHGFEARNPPSRYRYTAVVELGPSPEEIFASFSGTCRRFVRTAERRGFSVGVLDEAQWAPRMAELWVETFARTRGRGPSRTWERRLDYARRHPDLYRIVGMFGPGYPDPASLKSFSSAVKNSDHAVYVDGASTRDVPSGVSLSYAPMWDLIQWARRRNCTWFDLGGVPDPSSDDTSGRLDGITAFKRRFSGSDEVVEVRSEWRIGHHSPRTRVAEIGASIGRRVLRKLGVRRPV